MRTRSTIIAAFSLAAVTILAVAACGTSVSGSAQPNPAAESVSIPSNTDATAPPSDLSDLTSMLSDLPTGELPSDLPDLSSLLQDLPTDGVPSDLGDLTNLNIPGFNEACMTLPLAYASIGISTLGALTGGDGDFDSAGLTKAVSDFAAQAPPELADTAKALTDLAAETDGKSNADALNLLNSDVYDQAGTDVGNWVDANCAG